MSAEGRILRDVAATADRLAETLRLVHGDLAGKAPFTAEGVAALDRATQKDVLAFLKCFEQTQDLLANRLVRAILAETGADVAGWTLRDALDRMEAIGALDDAGRSMEMARLRNRLTHEYPMSDARRAGRVNAAWEMTPALLRDHETLAAYAARLPPQGDA